MYDAQCISKAKALRCFHVTQKPCLTLERDLTDLSPHKAAASLLPECRLTGRQRREWSTSGPPPTSKDTPRSQSNSPAYVTPFRHL